MVLVDTSVWIRFLAGRQPYLAELDRLLSLTEVAGHEFVYGELLIGDCGGRKKLLAAFEQMHQARTLRHREVATFVRQRELHGRGVSWIDVHLLASALVERFTFWTADLSLSLLAREIGIAHNV
jgi:predicted nucleic acid-binding protein